MAEQHILREFNAARARTGGKPGGAPLNGQLSRRPIQQVRFIAVGGPAAPPPTPNAALLRLADALRRCQRKLDKLTDELDRLAEGLANLSETSNGEAALPPDRKPGLLEQLGSRGEASMEWLWRNEEAAEVRIGSAPTLTLKGASARLLRLLADPETGTSDDHLVGWKSYKDLRSAMAQEPGHQITLQALKQAVHKLRNALAVGGVNPYLIHNNKRVGYRLALHRPASRSASQS